VIESAVHTEAKGADVTQPRRAGRLSGAIVLAVLLANGNSDVEFFAWPASPQRGAMSPIQRQTTFGPVVGTDLSAVNGTYVWKGVPYAKPPVGELRWKAPADPDAWSSPRLTQQFGHACAQASRLYGPGQNNKYDATIGTSLGKTVGSEDCLYLNIWRPANAAAQLPVIVWVHGGSNISGYTADPM
jgi:para-nitrobenzyl esterase